MIFCVKGFWEIHEDSANMFTYVECFAIFLAYILSKIVHGSFNESQITWLIVYNKFSKDW